MRYRTQSLLLLTAFCVLLTACGHANALVSVHPSPNEPTGSPDLADSVSFDVAFAPFLKSEGGAEDCILVRNKAHVLLDTCLLSAEELAALCTLLADSQPAPSHGDIKAADRGYQVEWRHGDNLLVMQSGILSDQSRTLLWLDNRPYHTEPAVYTEWIESFATAK